MFTCAEVTGWEIPRYLSCSCYFGYTTVNLIIPTTFLTHCVRVSIQIQANVIIFFINSIYNIKPLVMFRCDSISLDHHQWITNFKIQGPRVKSVSVGCLYRVKMIAFWDIAPCSLVEADRPYWGEHYLASSGKWRQYAPLKRRYTSRLHGVFPWRLSSSYSPPWEPKIWHVYRMSACTRLYTWCL
jgi:hypothetical protein